MLCCRAVTVTYSVFKSVKTVCTKLIAMLRSWCSSYKVRLINNFNCCSFPSNTTLRVFTIPFNIVIIKFSRICCIIYLCSFDLFFSIISICTIYSYINGFLFTINCYFTALCIVCTFFQSHFFICTYDNRRNGIDCNCQRSFYNITFCVVYIANLIIIGVCATKHITCGINSQIICYIAISIITDCC